MYKNIKKRYQRARKARQLEYKQKMERIQLKNQKVRQRQLLHRQSKKKIPVSPQASFKLDLKKSIPIEKESSSQVERQQSNLSRIGAASLVSQPSDLRRKTTIRTVGDQNSESRGHSPVNKFKELEDDRLIRWEDLQFSDKAALFNKWTIVAIIASFIQILSSFISLAQLDPHIIEYQALIGLGCMLGWINITRYIEYNRESAIFINTLGRSLPYVGRFLLGVFPIFLGYVFFGLSMFWNSKRFTTTSGAMMTLFAVLNGDMVYDTFHDLGFVNIVLSQIYMYSFVLLFINVVQNVFITIIEDGFISIKYKAEHEQFTKAPVRDEPDFRLINDENEKTGQVVMGATGHFGQTSHSSLEQGAFTSNRLSSSLMDIEMQRMKKKEKKKKLQYKSKVALYNIISDGRTRMIEQPEPEGKLPQWKIGLRTGHPFQHPQRQPVVSEEESKFSVNIIESLGVGEDRQEWKENLRKFGDQIVREIEKAEHKIEQNTSLFGKQEQDLDDEIRDEFQKQLDRIIEAAKKSSKSKP